MRRSLLIGVTAGITALAGAAAIVVATAVPGTAQPPASEEMQTMVQQCLAHMEQMDEMMDGMGMMGSGSPMDGMTPGR